MSIVINDDVGIIFGRLNELLIGRGYVVFPAIKHIPEVIPSLISVSDNPAFEFNVLAGNNKYL